MALENTGGRQTFYGQLDSENKFGGKIASAGSVKEIRYTFSYDDLPDSDSGNEMVTAIPAGAQIISSTFQVGAAWIGGTNIIIGLEDKDGTSNDPDGLHAAVVTANLTAGALGAGAGALIGIVGDATADQVVVASTTGTYTAGDMTLIVKYLPFGADAV